MTVNGAIPTSQLAKVDGGGWTALLAPGAALGWLYFCVVVVRLGGQHPRITASDGAYRNLARQVWYWVNRFRRHVSAAYPGTSNHGLGLAVDIANYLAIPRWILLEAARQAGWVFDVAGEGWHMRFTGAPRYTTNTAAAVSHIPEEDDMKLYVLTDAKNAWVLLNTRTGRYELKRTATAANQWARLFGNAEPISNADLAEGVRIIKATA